jgi:hypothetical protein
MKRERPRLDSSAAPKLSTLKHGDAKMKSKRQTNTDRLKAQAQALFNLMDGWNDELPDFAYNGIMETIDRVARRFGVEATWSQNDNEDERRAEDLAFITEVVRRAGIYTLPGRNSVEALAEHVAGVMSNPHASEEIKMALGEAVDPIVDEVHMTPEVLRIAFEKQAQSEAVN